MTKPLHTENLADADALLWNATQAARALGISTRCLWTLSNMGEIPSLKLGSRRLYPVDRLREYIAAKLEGSR